MTTARARVTSLIRRNRSVQQETLMPVWSATIPFQSSHGGSGVQVFIVDAAHYYDACGHALKNAQLPDARRHRRDAPLDTQRLAVEEIRPNWIGWQSLRD
ncbi:hypothetical protein [Streptomyces chartreusis]|uniref:hypothetical protein n=1 Tax=Streptomyces chartreusis TaxID=1969 RepID=UPI0036C85449